MPIHRSYVKSRADFFTVLDDTLMETRLIAGPSAIWTPIESILGQLDAMKRWTAHGRVPTGNERRSISITLIAERELQAMPEDVPEDLFEYVQKLYELSGYFKEWLTDDNAAAPDEKVLLNDFDL
jgi:hypothetical protein